MREHRAECGLDVLPYGDFKAQHSYVVRLPNRRERTRQQRRSTLVSDSTMARDRCYLDLDSTDASDTPQQDGTCQCTDWQLIEGASVRAGRHRSGARGRHWSTSRARNDGLFRRHATTRQGETEECAET